MEEVFEKFYSPGVLKAPGKLLVRKDETQGILERMSAEGTAEPLASKMRGARPETDKYTEILSSSFGVLAIDSTRIFFLVADKWHPEKEKEVLVIANKFTGKKEVSLTRREVSDITSRQGVGGSELPLASKPYPPPERWSYIRISPQAEDVEVFGDHQRQVITHVLLLYSESKLVILNTQTKRKTLLDLSEIAGEKKVSSIQPVLASKGISFFALYEEERKNNPELFFFSVPDPDEIEFTSRKIELETEGGEIEGSPEYTSPLFPFSSQEAGVIVDGGFRTVNAPGNVRELFEGVEFGGEDIHWITPEGNVLVTELYSRGGSGVIFSKTSRTQKLGEGKGGEQNTLFLPENDKNFTPLSKSRFVDGEKEVKIWTFAHPSGKRKFTKKVLQKLDFELDYNDIYVLHGSLFQEMNMFVVKKTEKGEKAPEAELPETYLLYSLDSKNNFTRRDYTLEPIEFLNMDSDPLWIRFVFCFLKVEIGESLPDDLIGVISRF